jgi:phosphoglycerate dehydrogenase-like enzyme
MSEVLTVHVPLDDSTRGLIGSDILARLPRGALVVNTSRSEILDSAALLTSLESGHLGGAALDVIPSERADTQRLESGLIPYARSHHNLLITPHIGGATNEAMERTEVFMAEKLRRHLAGEEV